MAGRPVPRREFLKAAGLTFAASLSPARAETMSRTDAVFASAFTAPSGEFGVALLAEDGEVIARIPLPVRGHDVAGHPATGHAVVFARRPGTLALAFDPARRRPHREIIAPPGRHFYGHGVFSGNGRLLHASENDFENAAGVIGVYDAEDGYRRIGEFPSGGTGPHDMLLLDDGYTLAVANGGIETHPEFGRTKLNISSMRPNLCFIDCRDGTPIETRTLPDALHQLSIRHLADDGNGSVYFACQYEGAPHQKPQLFGKVQRGGNMKLFEIDTTFLARLKNYVGSIAADPESGTFSVTSPRGNCMLVLDAGSGKVVAENSLANVCGVAGHGRAFVATTGQGLLFGTRRGIIRTGELQWDNHLARLSG